MILLLSEKEQQGGEEAHPLSPTEFCSLLTHCSRLRPALFPFLYSLRIKWKVQMKKNESDKDANKRAQTWRIIHECSTRYSPGLSFSSSSSSSSYSRVSQASQCPGESKGFRVARGYSLLPPAVPAFNSRVAFYFKKFPPHSGRSSHHFNSLSCLTFSLWRGEREGRLAQPWLIELPAI